jgi:hypothetical protein
MRAERRCTFATNSSADPHPGERISKRVATGPADEAAPGLCAETDAQTVTLAHAKAPTAMRGCDRFTGDAH